VRTRGCTLVEMLVALAVLAVMGGLALGLFSRLQGETRDLRRAAELTADLRALFQLLRQDLNSIVVRAVLGKAPLSAQAERRGEQEMDRFGLLRQAPSRPGAPFPFQQVTYSTQQEADGSLSVIRTVNPLLGARYRGVLTLIKGVRAFRTRYLTAAGEWVSEWAPETASRSALPRGVRVELELDSGAVWHSVFSLTGKGMG
jgi:type II secretion system protein J